jgi:FlaA1/EpsC-like NDP-sugar epimerase
MSWKPKVLLQMHGRLVLLMLRDAAVAVLTLWFAMMLRFEGVAPPQLSETLATFSPVAIVVLLVLGLFRGLYGSLPQYASLQEMLRLGGVVMLTALGLIVATTVYYLENGSRPLPLSVPLIWGPFLFFGLGIPRIYRRVRVQLHAGKGLPANVERVLIVGAGDAGEHVVRDMLRSPDAKFSPVGFVDDDKSKHGKKIHGLPVLGPIEQLADAAALKGAHLVIIALPSAPSGVVRAVLKRVAAAGLKAKILPSLGELMGAQVTSADVRDVDISDLIARNKVQIDMKQIASVLDGRTVLISGAAGSIGSELARQALYFRPKRLVILDNNETDLFGLEQRLSGPAQSRGTELRMVIADIRDRRGISRVFADHGPDLVFHAAAYKHVPVMELHPAEAIITNVTGTRNVAEAARDYNAERFVLVSTDKAVNPTSVMGATKRLAEMVIGLIGLDGHTIFTSVRFGNVLASRGSVVPIFAQQIRDGGPITVTDPEATRYFMTIEEAVALICQAAALGKGGQTFVLEMGEPVKIMDLADRMRKLLANGRSDEIEIVVTGLRPGEKLHEDLWNVDETLLPVQPGIMKTKHPAEDPQYQSLKDSISRLEALACDHSDAQEVICQLFAIAAVPTTQETSGGRNAELRARAKPQ